MKWLLGGVAAVGKDGLAGHPPAIGEQMDEEWNDVLDVGEPSLGRGRECGC